MSVLLFSFSGEANLLYGSYPFSPFLSFKNNRIYTLCGNIKIEKLAVYRKLRLNIARVRIYKNDNPSVISIVYHNALDINKMLRIFRDIHIKRLSNRNWIYS